MKPEHLPGSQKTLDNMSERSASPATPNSIAGAETVSAETASTPLSLEPYLAFPCDEPTISALRQQLAAGRLVVIRDAFVASFAERIYGALDACTAWRMYERYDRQHFHYRHHNLYEKSDYPSDLRLCDRIFESTATKALAHRLSGRVCIGPTLLTASWYLPGDHQLPHTDVGNHTFAFRDASDATIDPKRPVNREYHRQVAFVWYLTKRWQPEWGGAFFWCPRSIYLSPVFNTLVLFNVNPDTYHFVTEVSPYAQGKRLAVNGWWTGPTPTGTHTQIAPEQLRGRAKSIEIY
jgi:Rps23 Pro-64 3,4-dihydroxylase Tpa1-like proline 4-hydroxylase